MTWSDFWFERKHEFKLLAKSPHVLWLILVANILESFAYFTISMNFVLFISDQYGFSDQEAGIYYSGWGIAITIWGILTSFMGDALGPGISIIVSSVISCGARFILCFFTETLMFYITTFIVMPIGISWGIPVFRVAVKRCTNNQTKTLIYGLFYDSMNIGAFLAGLFITGVEKKISKKEGLVLFNHRYTPTQFMFLVSSIVTFLNLFFAFFILKGLKKIKHYEENDINQEETNINNLNSSGFINVYELNSQSNHTEMQTMNSASSYNSSATMIINDSVDDYKLSDIQKQQEELNLTYIETTKIKDSEENENYHKQNKLSFKIKEKNNYSKHKIPNVSTKSTDSGVIEAPPPYKDEETLRQESTMLVRPAKHERSFGLHLHEREASDYISDGMPKKNSKESECLNEEEMFILNDETAVINIKKSKSCFGLLKNIKEIAKNPFLYKIILMNFVMLFVKTLFRHLDATFPKYIKRSFDENVPFGALLSINPILIIFLVPIFQSITSGSKTYIWIIVGSFISAVSVFAMAFKPEVWLVITFLVIFSIGEAIYSPKIDEYTMVLSPKGKEMLFSMLSSLPLFFTKFIVGPFSGYILTTYCGKLTKNNESFEINSNSTMAMIQITKNITILQTETMTKTNSTVMPTNETARDCELMWFIIGCSAIITPFLLLVFKNYLNSDQVKSMLSKSYYKFHKLPEEVALDKRSISKSNSTIDEFGTLTNDLSGSVNIPFPQFDDIYDDAESLNETNENLLSRTKKNKKKKKRTKKANIDQAKTE